MIILGVFSRDILWTAIVNFAATFIGLTTGVILARALGPEGRGELAAIQNIPNLLLGFGSIGLTVAAGYISGREPRLAGRMMTTSLTFLILWSIPLLTICYLTIPVLLSFQSENIILWAQIYLLIIPIQFGISASSSVLQGSGQIKLWNLLRLQSPIAWFVIIMISWIFNSVTVSEILQLHLGATLLIACMFVVFALRRIPGPHKPELSRLPELVRYGLPIAITAIPQQLNQRLDQVVMAMFMPSESLGIYVVAVAWSNAFSPVLTSVSQVLFPRLAANHDPKVQAETLSRSMRLSVLITLIACATLFVLTPYALPLVFGLAFAKAIPLTFILIVATGISTINQVASDGLRGMGAPKLPIISEFAGLATTIGMLAIMLRQYELMGAAISALTSYSVTLALLLFLMSKKTKLSPARFVFPCRQDFLFLISCVIKLRQGF